MHYSHYLIAWFFILSSNIYIAPVGTMAVLPRENMGHGSALGYYYGFLRLVLPGND